MTTAELQDVLTKGGYKAEIINDGAYSLRIITDKPLPEYLRQTLDQMRPVGMAFHFATREQFKAAVPKALTKWYIETAKYMK